MQVKFFSGLLLLFCAGSACAQIGGQQSFQFLQLPGNARSAALGGVNVSLQGRDVNLFLGNPALLTDSLSGAASLNYTPYYAGIRHTSLTYARSLGRTGIWAAGLQYLDYGTFEETDPSGNVVGSFGASDYALTIGKSHTLGLYTLGVNLKVAGSVLANYHALALLADVGGVFRHPERDWTIGLSIRNVGAVLSQFSPDTQAETPFDVQLGTTFKPRFMPVRFSVTAHHLTRFDIAYNDPTQSAGVDENGNPIPNQVSVADKVMRHFAVGAELLLGRNFNLRAGYNHLIRRELRLENTSGGAGLSFGGWLKAGAFELAYSRSWYHVAGGVSTLCLTLHTGRVFRRKATS